MPEYPIRKRRGYCRPTITDRPIAVAGMCCDVRKKKATIIPYKELERYGRERKDSPLKNF